MIKTIFFDFDGTLIDLVEVHYLSLNRAILEVAGSEFLILKEEQDSKYNGLSTKTKLNLLVKEKKLDSNLIDKINFLKQKYTIEDINSKIFPNLKLREDLQKLKSEGFKLYCVSNAMLTTVEVGLNRLSIIDLFDHIVGNDNVKRQKPAPDIYLQAFVHAQIDPSEALIVEDSKHGRESAIRSGANLCTVDDPQGTTYEHIKKFIIKYSSNKLVKWSASNLKVVLPMSGAGSRFAQAGYSAIKPLIDVNGKHMIQLVIDNLNIDAEFIFIVQKAHYDQYNLGNLLPLIAPGCKIIQLDGLSEGAACSVLAAKEFINNDDHLFIINSDQYVDIDFSLFFNKMLTSKVDGGIITFHKENDKKWSYIKLNNDGYICEVKEKDPISNQATIGAYYWNKGSDFVQSAEEMISLKDKSNNEYYVAPTYNYLIKNNKKIINYEISPNLFWGIGTPEDLNYYLNNFKK